MDNIFCDISTICDIPTSCIGCADRLECRHSDLATSRGHKPITEAAKVAQAIKFIQDYCGEHEYSNNIDHCIGCEVEVRLCPYEVFRDIGGIADGEW